MDTQIFAGISKFKIDSRKYRKDDDFSDRVNHTLTGMILLFFTIIVSARQYIGKPISCWVPAEFTKSQEEYAESVCWVSNTYFISTSTQRIPESISQRSDSKIIYYQWVPFIFIIQAIMFNIPCFIWRLFNWQTGIHLSNIIEIAADIETVKNSEGRRNGITYVSRYIHQTLRQRKIKKNGSYNKCKNCIANTMCIWFGKHQGNFLLSLYFSTKCLYIINIVGQFFLMNEFLGSNYTFYGFDLFKHLSTGYLWEDTGNFPRITLCDFEVRKLANMHRYTVQCVLPINMFNEKIFIFMWFWFVFVGGISITSLLYWFTKIGFETSRIHFIRKYLKLRNVIGVSEMKPSCDFTINYLKQDGVLILRLMSQNIGDLLTSEVIVSLWKQYKCLPEYENIRNNKKKTSIIEKQRISDEIIFPHCLTSINNREQRFAIQNMHTSSSSSVSTEKSNKYSNKSNKREKRKIKGEKNDLPLDQLEEDPGEFV